MLNPVVTRTRIKICGLTRAEDVHAAVDAGADAIGLVFYPPSPRFVSFEQAAALAAEIPAFVTIVGLFVNPEPDFVRTAITSVPLQMLQFHGEESAELCQTFTLPWIKAARVRAGLDLLEFASTYSRAAGILLDAYVDGYGGAGKTFDWALVPDGLGRRLILSGGLDIENVGVAVKRLRPWAVDVSSGVESAKGIKDAAKIAAFIKGVRNADG